VTPASKSVAVRTVVLAALVVAGMAVVALLPGRRAASPGPAGPALAGNHAFSDDDLRAAIAADTLADADLLLSAFYWDRGYAAARVERRGEHIAIDEGPLFHLGAVTVTGAFGVASVLPGDVFSRRRIADDRERLTTWYQDRGFAYVNVLPISRIDTERRTIDLTFEIEPGKRARFERVTIAGNLRVPEAAIRHAFGVAAGQPFSASALVAGKRRVMGLGLHTVDVATLRGSSDELVVVRVEVTE